MKKNRINVTAESIWIIILISDKVFKLLVFALLAGYSLGNIDPVGAAQP